jgi:hypothetical protein
MNNNFVANIDRRDEELFFVTIFLSRDKFYIFYFSSRSYSLAEGVESQNLSEPVRELNERTKSVSPTNHRQTNEPSPEDIKRMRFVTTFEKDQDMNKSAEATSETSNDKNDKIVQEFDISVGWPTHAMVGNLRLPFPHFNIKPTFFEGKRYSAANTCSLDSSLFLLYYIYMSNSKEFRSLFDPNIPICEKLLKTFDLVENQGWDIARIYWISIHSTGSSRNDINQHHDLFTTADNNVFQYVRDLQKYVIKSTCTSTDCPKLVLEKRSVDIAIP